MTVDRRVARRCRATLVGLCGVIVAASACAGDPHEPGPGTGREFGGVRELFRVDIAPGVRPGHGPALDADRIYFDLGETTGVVAHDRITGQRSWTYARPFGGPSNVVAHQGTVFFVGEQAIALDAATGAERWRFDPEGNGSLGTSAADDRAFYFGTDRHLFALGAADGSLRWKADLGDESWAYRSIVRGVSVGGDTVYANVERYLSESGHINHAYIFALDRHTGETLWTFREGDGETRHFFWRGPRIAGPWLLHGDFDMNVYIALDRMTGEVRWRTPGDPGGYFGPPEAPWVSNDTVYGVSADRWATAMTLEAGAVLWSTRVLRSAYSLALCGSRVLVADDALNVMDRLTGQLLAMYEDDTRTAAGTVAHTVHSRFVVDGRVAYLLGSHYAYAFECPE